MANAAAIWEETVTIPTYRVSPPEKIPLFLEKRAYQGSTGKVYPFPVTEKISDKKEDVVYHAVFLENEYLRLMILPELGGRIQRALDKTNGYDFVYYNHVIKPALVGLTGPWISGGIEFNWPQHHRPTTFSPVDYSLCKNSDGSCSIFLGETDRMYGTKGMATITLYPGKAYIEIRGRLSNPTDLPQTFLWWANPAVPVNETTYSVFPPDVSAVMDHGRRAVSTFPIATGEYYKWDYSEGVDISRYQNIKVPTSYMAAHSDFDFIGNYDEAIGAGLLHVADHHISPGKKQWTWGSGDFGKRWDRNLTDSDGPYIELMTGVFTDNQPDFSWLKPHEEKNFVQYFMPYKGVGRVGNATKEAAIGLEEETAGAAVLRVYTSACYPGVRVTVFGNGGILYQTDTDLSPETCFTASFPLSCPLTECRAEVRYDGRALAAYQVYKKEPEPVPEPEKPLASPDELKSAEELYLAALHLEQYRHATCDPADYYLEGLRRDPSDIRLNNGYGLLLLKRGQIDESIPYFQKAIEKQTWRNPNPYEGECYFNLGIALNNAGRTKEAYDAFYKSTWNAETQSAGFYRLACLKSADGDYESALAFLTQALIRNWHDGKTRTLKAAILRLLGSPDSDFLEECLKIDPLCMGYLYEKALREGTLSSWKRVMRGDAHNYLTLALEYMDAGLYEDAVSILTSCEDQNPLLLYYEGCAHSLSGNGKAAFSCCRRAEDRPADYCFPNRLEEQRILEHAIRILENAPMAHYYLGCLFYDKKQYEKAILHWETCISQKDTFAPAYRNLSIAYYNKRKDSDRAIENILKACRLDPSYPRYRLEFDQLAARRNLSISERLAAIESWPGAAESRDDLFLRRIALLNCLGRYEDALSALRSRIFHPWEGGEGKVSFQYRFALIQSAALRLARKNARVPQSPQALQNAGDALELLQASLSYPDNLGEGKLPNVPDNEAWYYMGLASGQLGAFKDASAYFRLAASGPAQPSDVLYYNDQPSDFIFYQGLAYRELGEEAAARKSFHRLLSYGERHRFDRRTYDFFAVSLPEIEVYQEDIAFRNEQYCRYLRALGCLGLGRKEEAAGLADEILARQNDYQGALALKNYMENFPEHTGR